LGCFKKFNNRVLKYEASTIGNIENLRQAFRRGNKVTLNLSITWGICKVLERFPRKQYGNCKLYPRSAESRSFSLYLALMG